MSTVPLYWLVLLASLVLIRVLFGSRRNNRGLPHPPGPTGLPFIGNVRDVPKKYAWVTYFQWSTDYASDLIRLNILGNNVIIINTTEAATDLLDKRGSIYSDRPVLTMLGELCGFYWNAAFLRYGNEWKNARRAFQRELSVQSVKKYRPILVSGTNRLLGALLVDSRNILDHLQLMSSRHILGLAYGIDVSGVDDPYVTVGKQSVQAVTSCTLPGSFLVDTFPLLKFVPSWFPGAGFQSKAASWKYFVTTAREKPYSVVKDCMTRGEAHECVGRALIEAIESKQDSSLSEDDVKSALGTMYSAGTDTTMAALGFFILAMVLNPEVQAKAQQIIDEVCGDHLPTFEDQPLLPCVDALVKESLRWHPVLPLNVPHVSTEDDVYNGFFIPKGSQVVTNSWAILHDERMYPDPSRFNPDRWLKDGKLNPEIRDPDAAFGAGRRICAGQHMAYEAMWITIAQLLATFEIHKAKDANGNPITPSEDIILGFACYPKPFPYEIRPRSADHVSLIYETLAELT